MAGRASPPLKAAGTPWLRLRAAAPSGSETASPRSLSISERVSPAHWLSERICEIGSPAPAIRSHAARQAPPLAKSSSLPLRHGRLANATYPMQPHRAGPSTSALWLSFLSLSLLHHAVSEQHFLHSSQQAS